MVATFTGTNLAVTETEELLRTIEFTKEMYYFRTSNL